MHPHTAQAREVFLPRSVRPDSYLERDGLHLDFSLRGPQGIRLEPRGTAVARKRSWSFHQRCRWQVTAKHACTLRMWLCMKRHICAWLYGVHRTCAETAAVSRGTSHVTVKQRCKHSTSVDVLKRAIKS